MLGKIKHFTVIGSLILLAPTFAQAQDFGAISSASSDIGGIIRQFNQDMQNIASTIQNKQNEDLSREELAWALINYDAAARVREYQLNRELLFMQAPGIQWALEAAEVISKNTLKQTSMDYANKGYLSSLQQLTKAKQINVDGQTIQFDNLPTTSPTRFFNRMEKFFTNGDAGTYNRINPANLLKNDNINKANLSPEDAVLLIALMTDPLPTIDPTVANNLAKGNLTANDKEALARYLAQSVAVGVSANAISDVVARRTQVKGEKDSVMEMMTEYSTKRFEDPNWYNALTASSEPAILREIAQMMAFSLWMQNQQFRLQEQQTTMLATFNANMSKLTSMIEALNATIGTLSQTAGNIQTEVESYTPPDET